MSIKRLRGPILFLISILLMVPLVAKPFNTLDIRLSEIEASNIHFEAIPASKSGIDEVGASYGGAWGDVNGDGYPDLWINNHTVFSEEKPPLGCLPGLYLNQRNGTFKNATAEIFLKEPKADFHGTAWADFDNDGDQDLLQLTGAGGGLGAGEKLLYVNELGKLEDQASSRGVNYPLARGRSPIWLDFNNDGLLDLVMGSAARRDQQKAQVKIFQQLSDGTFEDASEVANFKLPSADYFIYSDLSGDRKLDLIAENSGRITVYNTTSLPFADITSAMLPEVKAGNDMVSADFNGDLLPDLYLTRGTSGGTIGVSDFYQSEANTITARINVGDSTGSNESGLQFESRGEVTFEFGGIHNFIFNKSDTLLSQLLDEIYIGANGNHPTSSAIVSNSILSKIRLNLSPDDPSVAGISPYKSGTDRGIYIGYNPASHRWQMLLSGSTNLTLITKIKATNPINDLTSIGFSSNLIPTDDTLLINTPQGLLDKSVEAGINSSPIYGKSAVAGDFDNDMDQDIFIVTSRAAVNTPDILYENQGDGTFVAIPNAGGAAGTELGQGDFVISADYDLDGFLDLFVANGDGDIRYVKLLTMDAPSQLFHNKGNKNHWLEIDLQGLVSNRDGIGAQVILKAGGIKQLREQSGGIHHNVQNHQRIHFGLGDNTLVQELLIRWPSGREQRITNIPVDKLVRVIEGQNPTFIKSPAK